MRRGKVFVLPNYGKRVIIKQAGRAFPSDIGHRGVLDILVHATSTSCLVGDLHADETLVSPACAPGVLDEPVVRVTVGVRKAASWLGAGVPPLGDVAILHGRGRIGVAAVAFGVAYNGDCVIQTRVGAISVGDHAASIVTEDSIASPDSNRNWLCCDQVFEGSHVTSGCNL